MKKVIALILSLMFVWSVLNPQSVYAGANNELKTKPINVAFCFDENFWMQAGVTITSLLCMAEEKCCYNIYCVVPDSVNQTMRNILKGLVKKRSTMSSIKFLTVANQLDNIAAGMPQEAAQRKRAVCYRLLLPELLPNLDKIIYTDVDIIFNCDLQELDKIDISKYYVAGELDFYRHKGNFQSKIWDRYGLYDLNSKGQYINAGVLVINLKKIRQDGIDKKWFEIINEDFPFHDQDIINISCAGNVLVLSGCNIIHYAGQIKPWEVRDNVPKHWSLWWYYAGQTPFINCFMKSVMQRQYDDRFKVLPKWLSRVFCWFIPKKEARRQFRKKYMAEDFR